MKIIKFRCANCKKTLISKAGSLDKTRKIKCRFCGEENIIDKKKNGKFIVRLN